ncbi:fucolectin-like [Hyperolius riggenbachi]|uniref:fucolectin-like n=1 Tax=Hyperolius riggenbachi TaxID=752182 RepID=UPI0035A33BB6
MVYMKKRTMPAVVIFTLIWMLVDAEKKEENVALRGRATMSSNYRDSDSCLSAAINAIDGNPDGDYYHGSCFSTARENSPWWRVDLLETYTISHIVLTTRGSCCEDEIIGADILIGDFLNNYGNNNHRCAKVTSMGTQTFYCPGMKGRYVNVVNPGQYKALTFCEIQIFGVPVDSEENKSLLTQNTKNLR